MKRRTTVMACALTIGLVAAPMGVYADHHGGGHGHSEGSMKSAGHGHGYGHAHSEGSMKGHAESAANDTEDKAQGAMDDVEGAMKDAAHKAHDGSH